MKGWASFIDHPQVLQFAIAALFYGAIMTWSAITMHYAVWKQRQQQKRWLDERSGNWE